MSVFENLADFGGGGTYYSINLNGFFKTSLDGTYTFIFYDTNNGLCNDDISYFYLGSNAVIPTLDNINMAVDFTVGAGGSTYSVDLSGNTYYPLQLFYGQSYGGQVFSFGFTPPQGNSILYDGTGYFYTVNGSGQSFAQYVNAINTPVPIPVVVVPTPTPTPTPTPAPTPIKVQLGTLSLTERDSSHIYLKERITPIGIGTTRNWRQKYRKSSG
jgi:hypothetical protein